MITAFVSSHLMDDPLSPAGTSCYMQALGSAELLKQQACYLPCTDDGVPVIGKVPGLENNAYVATGDNNEPEEAGKGGTGHSHAKMLCPFQG
jgi:hypothetical protein